METVDLEQAESEMENTQYIKKHIKNKICYFLFSLYEKSRRIHRANRWFESYRRRN